MNLFTFSYGTGSTLNDATFIDKFKSISWVERYRGAGEFKVVAPLSSGILEKMPLDSLVSHVETRVVMIVENHRITESYLQEPMIEVSGRGFEAWLDNRIVGGNESTWNPGIVTVPEFFLAPNTSYGQAEFLITRHISAVNGATAAEQLNGLYVQTTVTTPITPQPSVVRFINRGGVYERVQELLAIDDFGLLTLRQPADAYSIGSIWGIFLIHNGHVKTDSVLFSMLNGDIQDSEYIHTNQMSKNMAMAVSNYVQVFAAGPAGVTTGFNRREMLIDVPEIDRSFTSPPPIGSADRATITTNLTNLGKSALALNNEFTLARCDISSESKYKYRRDYDIGDFVQVETKFGGNYVMRVVENTEIEDENGVSSHPTLEAI